MENLNNFKDRIQSVVESIEKTIALRFHIECQIENNKEKSYGE